MTELRRKCDNLSIECPSRLISIRTTSRRLEVCTPLLPCAQVRDVATVARQLRRVATGFIVRTAHRQATSGEPPRHRGAMSNLLELSRVSDSTLPWDDHGVAASRTGSLGEQFAEGDGRPRLSRLYLWVDTASYSHKPHHLAVVAMIPTTQRLPPPDEGVARLGGFAPQVGPMAQSLNPSVGETQGDAQIPSAPHRAHGSRGGHLVMSLVAVAVTIILPPRAVVVICASAVSDAVLSLSPTVMIISPSPPVTVTPVSPSSVVFVFVVVVSPSVPL
ncbi:hypothetical protein EDB86DRAFT_3108550 [Lactarius hatsudake]|nr:hypothetical protein EDB86DRAFT_3108550 [Lactarius hatsudake]